MSENFNKLRKLGKKAWLLPILSVILPILSGQNNESATKEDSLLQIAQSDPKTFAVLERMRLVAEVNKNPNYFFDNFSVFVNSGLFDKGDIYDLLYKLIDRVDIETLLRFVLNNKLEDYLNSRFLDKVFWASLDKNQQDVFYTLLSYNLRPTIKELANSDIESRRMLLHIPPGLIELVNKYTLNAPKMTSQDWKTIKEALSKRWGDKEAEKYLEHMRRLSESHDGINPVFVAQTLWSVAKLAKYYSINYGYSNPKTAINVAAWSYVEAVQNVYKEKIFRKNILLIDHNERYKNGQDRFATKSLRDALRKRGKLMYIPDSMDSKSRKRKFLNSIRVIPKLTVYVDAHGAKDAVYLSDGSGDSVKISIGDFVSALKDRSKALNKDDYKISIIFAACYSANIAYGILSSLPSNVPIPLIISNAEFAQVSFSRPTNPYGSNFEEMLVKLNENSVKALLLEVMKAQRIGNLDSNPSIFAKGVIKEGDKQAYGVRPDALRFLRFLQLG